MLPPELIKSPVDRLTAQLQQQEAEVASLKAQLREQKAAQPETGTQPTARSRANARGLVLTPAVRQLFLEIILGSQTQHNKAWGQAVIMRLIKNV